MITSRNDLKQMFGSFWNNTWKDPDLYKALLTATNFMFERLQGDVAQLPEFLNRFDVPVSKTRSLKYGGFSQLELTRKYVTLGSYLMDQGHKLDELTTNPSIWVAAAPTDKCLAIIDNPVEPNLALSRGAHFDIVGDELRLYIDPFEESFRQHLVVENDNQIKLVDLWFVHTEDDANYLTDYYGRVIRMLTPSTRYYRRILNAIYDLLQEGGTAYRTALFVGALLDTDVANGDGEVTVVWDEGDRTWVAVGDTLHSCPGIGNAIVAVGDQVQTGDRLFNTFNIMRGREEIDPGDFPQLVLSNAFIETPSGKALSFENAELEVTDYKFPIGGDPSDVEYFWATADLEAAARGIDLQEAIIGDQHAPFTVNPFELVRSNFLASSVIFITADLAILPDPEAIKLLRYLDAVLPASTTYILNAFAFADEETSPIASTDEAEPLSVGEADELDITTITDYVIGNEKLY